MQTDMQLTHLANGSSEKKMNEEDKIIRPDREGSDAGRMQVIHADILTESFHCFVTNWLVLPFTYLTVLFFYFYFGNIHL